MKQLNWNVYTTSMVRVMKALLAAYVVTGLLLLAIAGFLYRFQWDEGKVQIGIILTYILSCFIGGFLAGKMMKSRKFLWGVLLGLLYFLVMTLVSVAVNRELQSSSSGMITSFLLCMGGGMLGGMLS
ncbi:MAG: TIGR04086 family membrane protein [Lachnospiraceae bacterium]|jgi:putative membrane protein (TIGR04086 family)|nr:TIGR04086 family membrane protein [Lachnospiraceae bacterium]